MGQSSSQLKVGDLVRVELGQRAVRTLQDGHGGWNESMSHIFDDIGLVVHKDEDGDLKVLYENGQGWTMNPAALVKVTAPKAAMAAQQRGILSGAMEGALAELAETFAAAGLRSDSDSDSEEGESNVGSSRDGGHLRLLGTRVVRGPDWRWGTQDGGEGGVGTIVRHYLRPQEVIVQWDGGHAANYRYATAVDLRILDSAPSAQSHPHITCDGCDEPHLAGVRWKCEDCENYDLCSYCYHEGKHDSQHVFKRLVWPGGEWESMAESRSKAATRESRGAFVGATVVRGRNWKWSEQDGGAGKSGKIIENKAWSGTMPRSAVRVEWASGSSNTYRMGAQGCVDVKATSTTAGPRYFLSHLAPLKAEGSPPIPAAANPFHPGDTVRLINSESRLRHLQQGHGGFTSEMSRRLGARGKVLKVDVDGDILVEMGQHSWFLNPEALESPDLTLDEELRVDDSVCVELELDVVRAMQEGHGGWSEKMSEMLGKPGRVIELDEDGDARVKFSNGDTWFLNPAVLTKTGSGGAKSPCSLPSGRPLRTKEDFALGEWIRTCGSEADTKQMQEGHGGWAPTMAAALGKVGKIVEWTKTDDARVEIGNHTWTYAPSALDKFPAPFQVNERVRVEPDEARVKRLQEGHGGFVVAMKGTLGETGSVVGYSANGDVRIAMQGKTWIFAAELLQKPNIAAASSASSLTSASAQGSVDLAASSSSLSSSSTATDYEALERLQKQLQAHTCPVCLTDPRAVVFLCGHGACEGCNDQLRECPVCRKNIAKRIRLF